MWESRTQSAEKTDRASVIEVAHRVGVSIATVSRIISLAGHVSAQTRHRVEQATRELDYTPDNFVRFGISL